MSLDHVLVDMPRKRGTLGQYRLERERKALARWNVMKEYVPPKHASWVFGDFSHIHVRNPKKFTRIGCEVRIVKGKHSLVPCKKELHDLLFGFR